MYRRLWLKCDEGYLPIIGKNMSRRLEGKRVVMYDKDAAQTLSLWAISTWTVHTYRDMVRAIMEGDELPVHPHPFDGPQDVYQDLRTRSRGKGAL